jgi:hypothetical protein
LGTTGREREFVYNGYRYAPSNVRERETGRTHHRNKFEVHEFSIKLIPGYLYARTD